MTEPGYFGTKNRFVEQKIREAIMRQEVMPGDWLRPDEWSRRLGVSQTPVREALRKLEAAGLVMFHPHRGAQVVSLNLQDFVEVYRIRAVLEGLAVKLALTENSPEEIDDLLETIEDADARYGAAAKEGDLQLLRRSNTELHMALYRAAKAPRLLQMIENLWATFPWDTLSLIPGRAEHAGREHDHLFSAIRDRDAERAGAAMTLHVERAAEDLLHYLEKTEGQPWERRNHLLGSMMEQREAIIPE